MELQTPGWRHYIADFLTGEQKLDVTRQVLAGNTWAVRMNSYGDANATLRLAGSGYTMAESQTTFGGALEPWSNRLISVWKDADGESVMHDGIILDEDSDPFTDDVSLDTSEARTLFARRFLFRIGAYMTFKSKFENITFRRAAYEAFRQVFLVDGVGRHSLPLVDGWMPAGIATETGTYTAEWFHHHLQTLNEILNDLTEADNGPDFDMRTERVGSSFRYRPRFGNPRLASVQRELDLTTKQHHGIRVRERTIGRDQLTGVAGSGEGSGEKLMVSQSALEGGESFSGPFLDTTSQFPDVHEKSLLDAKTRGLRIAHSAPSKVLELTVRAGGSLSFHDLEPGMQLKVILPANMRYPRREYVRTLTGYSGDSSHEIKTTLEAL